MTDQCENCSIQGDINKCRATPCYHHENWYAVEQQIEINQLKAQVERLREELPLVLGSLLEICHERKIPRPESAIRRAEAVLEETEAQSLRINQGFKVMSDWKLIDTAPKDGTTIIVSNETNSDCAYWDYEDWCAPHSCSNSIPYNPTHWAPMPILTIKQLVKT